MVRARLAPSPHMMHRDPHPSRDFAGPALGAAFAAVRQAQANLAAARDQNSLFALEFELLCDQEVEEIITDFDITGFPEHSATLRRELDLRAALAAATDHARNVVNTATQWTRVPPEDETDSVAESPSLRDWISPDEGAQEVDQPAGAWDALYALASLCEQVSF